jgi:hypothetical protein
VKRKKLFVIIAVLVATAFFVLNQQPVQATNDVSPTPSAAGSWRWDNEDVTGTVIPQYVLAPTYEEDYALLQSEGIHISGAAEICYPYPGGQFGWTAEIRVLTASGWQQVPTVNAWVPDVEGMFMTCAQANYSGTYTVFGYWERPEGWNPKACPTLPDGDFIYVQPVATYHWSNFIDPEGFFLDSYEFSHTICTPRTNDTVMAIFQGSGIFGQIFGYTALLPTGIYCGCESIYQAVPGN